MEWIKLSTALFSDDKIVLIRSERNGDELLMIWIRLLCMAGANDNSGKFNWTANQFATLMGKKTAVISKAFGLFESLGMVELREDGTLNIVHWTKYQSSDKYAEMRDKHREAQRKYREKKKGDITGDITVIQGDGIDKNKIRSDRDIEIEKDKKEITPDITRKRKRSASGKLAGEYQQHERSEADFGDEFYLNLQSRGDGSPHPSATLPPSPSRGRLLEAERKCECEAEAEQ